MLDMARMLAHRGHSVKLIYACEGRISTLDTEIRTQLDVASGNVGRLEVIALDLRSHDQIKASAGEAAVHSTSHQWVLAARKTCERRLACVGSQRFRNRQLLRFYHLCRALRKILRIRFPTIHSFVATLVILNHYAHHLKSFRSEFRRLSCDAVLIPEDVVGAVWPLAIKAAREIGIPSLVFPYTLANQKEAVQSLKGEPAFQTKNNRWAARLFPRWRWRKEGLDLVRLPASHIAAHDWFRISPPDPWMMNSGFSDAICVDSQASRDYFVNSGIPAGKIVITGSVSQDHLYDQLRRKDAGLERLRCELVLEGTKPMLLISGCPNQLAGKVPFCQFSSIEDIAEHVGRALEPLRSSYHLVVRPHPNFPNFAELLRPWGVTPTMIATSRLVPLSDLFIAFASATIRWAIACAVPTVNYDVFNYRYGDFSGATGVRTVTDAEDFARVLREMGSGTDAYRDTKARIGADAAYWSMMDGRSVERIEAAIEKVYWRRRSQHHAHWA